MEKAKQSFNQHLSGTILPQLIIDATPFGVTDIVIIFGSKAKTWPCINVRYFGHSPCTAPLKYLNVQIDIEHLRTEELKQTVITRLLREALYLDSIYDAEAYAITKYDYSGASPVDTNHRCHWSELGSPKENLPGSTPEVRMSTFTLRLRYA